MTLHELIECNKRLKITGICNTEIREKAIEDAIKAIQIDNNEALKTEYIGVKNYAHFGDQRYDCSYGCGPTHGHIVFSIGRRWSDNNVSLTETDIEFLIKARDFRVSKEIIEKFKATSITRAIELYLEHKEYVDYFQQEIL